MSLAVVTSVNDSPRVSRYRYETEISPGIPVYLVEDVRLSGIRPIMLFAEAMICNRVADIWPDPKALNIQPGA